MILHSKHYPGPGAPLVILHGLYGNHANWAWHARRLAEHFDVHAFDARNHGESPWAASMELAEMAHDVAQTMAALGLHSAHVLGHSMGGKTAMQLALQEPGRVRSLVIVDIAPVNYGKEEDDVLQGLVALDLEGLQSRAAADAQLQAWVKHKPVRDFLLTNLRRGADGRFSWRINLPVIQEYLRKVTDWNGGQGSWPGPALFIKGETSSYILPVHRKATLAQFPNADLKIVTGAGHWVHSEKPEAVLRLIENFLLQPAVA
jgi:esterase